MNVLTETDGNGPEPAGCRIAELARMFTHAREKLEQMIHEVGLSGPHDPEDMIAKLTELQAVHLRVVAAEEAFHANQDAAKPGEELNLDDVRAEIGRQLDRLRRSLDSD